MAKFFVLDRKIHRALVLVTAFLALAVSLSGILITYPKLISYLSLKFVVVLNFHKVMGALFAAVLIVMVFTGLFMYYYPIFRNRS